MDEGVPSLTFTSLSPSLANNTDFQEVLAALDKPQLQQHLSEGFVNLQSPVQIQDGIVKANSDTSGQPLFMSTQSTPFVPSGGDSVEDSPVMFGEEQKQQANPEGQDPQEKTE